MFPLIASVCMILLGTGSLLFPQEIARILGIQVGSILGRSEFRATYGGFFLALGLAALWVQSQDVFMVIGSAWLGAAGGRIISLALERSVSVRSLLGVVIEGVFGVLFLIALGGFE